ncbi:hypothetical protein [Deinococcus wulumuqiensis]|uniref:hypothetical protein n=1 Tax=Deinococcus wulumuqiensis TaxID=980427 RepID=UPI00242B0246|nr:hypothetical protein [Deinococcus wulumuqiensis]
MRYGRDFIKAIDHRHALHGYNTNFWQLAASMSIPVVQAEHNSALYLPAPLITLDPEVYGSYWSFTRFHELAHIVLRDSGIEAQLAQDADHPEQFVSWMEAYCNFGAAQFQMPNPVLRHLLGIYGYGPEVVVQLAGVSGVDLFDAMYRVTHGFLEADATRTTFLTQGSYLRKAVTTNRWFPHREGDRLPEVALAIPQARLMSLPERWGRHRVLGTLED